MTETERIPWHYTAEYYESCNCAYGCPCNFSGFPTNGNCRGVVVYHMREGRHGDTDLAGALVVAAFAWPKAIHDGDGTFAVFFDEGTNQAQQEAIGRIFTAQDGGLPHEIIAATVGTMLGPFVTKVDMKWNGTDSSVRIGDQVVSEMETFRNPVTNEPNEVHIVLPEGFIWGDARACNVKRIQVAVNGLSFTEQNTNGFHSVVTHSNKS